VLELGAAYLESMNIETLTRTHLEELASRTGDSASLSVLDGADIVYVARASVRTLMRLEAHVGSRFPAYPTSMGRVLLSGLGRERLLDYLEKTSFTPFTEHTVTDRTKLHKLIDESRLWRRRDRSAGIRSVATHRRVTEQLQPFEENHEGATRARTTADAAGNQRPDLARIAACSRTVVGGADLESLAQRNSLDQKIHEHAHPGSEARMTDIERMDVFAIRLDVVLQ
jgi:hypothetical protein